MNGSFEHLWPLADYVSPLYLDNLTAFLDSYPYARQAVDVHDARLRELASVCNSAFRRLLAAGDFLSAVQNANATAANKGIRWEDARGAIPAEQWPNLIAEYLINNVRALPEHYTTASYWREVGAIVFDVRNSASLHEQFAIIHEAGGKLLKATERTEEILVSIRQTYTRKFGLPPVPLPPQVEASGA